MTRIPAYAALCGLLTLAALVAAPVEAAAPASASALTARVDCSGGHGTLRRMAVEMINWRAAEDRQAEVAALRHNLGALMLHEGAESDALAFAIHDISCHGTRFRSKDVSLAGGLQDALATHAGPQLLVWGEFDVTADPRPLVAQLAAGHPQRHAVVVDGAGHWVQYERAEATNRLLVDFLG